MTQVQILSLAIIPPLAVVIAAIISRKRRRVFVQSRTAIARKIVSMFKAFKDPDGASRFKLNPGPDFCSVHDSVSGQSLTMARTRRASTGKWWVLYEEFTAGPERHLADRRIRMEAKFSDAHPAAGDLRSFVELAKSSGPPSRPAAVAVPIVPFEPAISAP